MRIFTLGGLTDVPQGEFCKVVSGPSPERPHDGCRDTSSETVDVGKHEVTEYAKPSGLRPCCKPEFRLCYILGVAAVGDFLHLITHSTRQQ